MSIAKFARVYFRLGWGVIELYGVTDQGVCSCREGPNCKAAGKHPVDGVHEIAPSVEAIDALGALAETTPRNVGIALGAASGIFVLDVDPRNGGVETLAALQATHGALPPCPTVETGGGGAHYFFAYPEGAKIKNGVNKLGPGLDIKSDGGYVVAAPSIHKSGKRYRWAKGCTPKDVAAPPPPAWLLELVTATPSVFDNAAVEKALSDVPLDTRLAKARKALAKMPAAIEGKGGDEQTFKAASVGWACGLDADEFFPLLEEYNKRCKPPWDEDALRSKIRENPERPFGWRLAPPIETPAEGEPADGAPEVPVLDSANEIALARQFLKDLGTVKSDGASLYVYNPTTGAWAALDSVTAKGRLQGYHGATIYSDEGETSKLNLTKSKRDAALDCALHEKGTTDPAFFTRPNVGAAFANGFVTLVDGKLELVPHAPEHRALSSLPYELVPGADFTAWDKFLGEIWRDEPDIEQRKMVLQEFLGASLLGLATRYARCLVLTGEGNNGKSTLMEIITGALFAPEAVRAVPPQKWAEDKYAARLHGVKLNAVSELPEHEMLANDTFKQIITGEQITARHLWGHPFDFAPVAGHLFSANDLPTTSDNTKGFWRRLIVLSFNRDFSADPTTYRTKADVVAEHVPNAAAIAWWAVIGAQRLIEQRGYTIPPSHDEGIGAWRKVSDPVSDFVSACCTIGDEPTTALKDIYARYREWAEKAGRKTMSNALLGRRLGHVPGVRSRKRSTMFYNIVVKPPKDWADVEVMTFGQPRVVDDKKGAA
jgi:putative DNA primase/helicase